MAFLAMRAPADGSTLMPGNMSQFAINPGLYSKLPYETLRDFALGWEVVFAYNEASLPAPKSRCGS